MQAPTALSVSDSAKNNLPGEPPVCKPTKWFLWRILAMLLMFTIFMILFIQDGIWGYREKNLQFYLYENFKDAGIRFQKMHGESGFSEQAWRSFAGSQQCVFPEDAQQVLPRGTDLPMVWPASLVEGYAIMEQKGGQNGAIKLWEEYAAERRWDATPMDHPMEAHKIREQFYAAGVTGVLVLITLYFLQRTMRRSIRADEQALYTQDGKCIAYTDMVRIDKRKWDTKGLATVYYKEGGEEKKARIDGMVYGQFKEEDGAPAERLFHYVMERFRGEVIEYVDEDEPASDTGPQADDEK